MIIVKATKESGAGVMPSERLLTEMSEYNEELVNAGVMLTGEGFLPSSKDVHVHTPKTACVQNQSDGNRDVRTT